MPNRRTYTDEQLRVAISNATCWADVAEALGKHRHHSMANAQAVAQRLSLDTSHFVQSPSRAKPPDPELPFTNPSAPGSQSGLSVAARWFLDRGYAVSVPLEPTAYDLVVESDDGLKRVQVKTTRRVQASGRYTVRTSRQVHTASARRNANGNRRAVPYTADSVDLFFIVTPSRCYIIPIAVTGSRLTIVLDDKYAAYAV
jgi:PD-(D/E)XK endonuclease